VANLRQILFGRTSPAPPPEPVTIDIEGRAVTVRLKRHAVARRMVLRLARDGESFTLTLPKRQSLISAKAFIETSRIWIQNTLAKRGRADEARDTSTIMLRGQTYTIIPTGKSRGLVSVDDTSRTLHVPGAEAHMKRRLTDWLKCEAERELRAASSIYAAKMEARFTKVTLRDQKSRWGSCTTDGALSYSWRLILAPPHVLDYVAAHEVAHLKEMNHGPRFWRLVLKHCPTARTSMSWLKANGHKLHHQAV
jgi:predicted metal-dependent hydrolase